MIVRGFQRTLLAGLLFLSLPTLAETIHPPIEYWLDRVPEAEVSARVHGLVTIARAGDLAALESAVGVHARGAAERPEYHEAVLLGLVRALAEEAPQAELEPILDGLAGHEPTALAGHPEGPHHGIPAYPVAAAAAGALNRWAGETAAREATAALAAGDANWFIVLAASRPPRATVRGVGQALAVADPESIRTVLPSLEAIWATDPAFARTALAAAGVLDDPAPLRAVVAGPGASLVMPDLARLETVLPASTAFAYWGELADDGPVGARSIALVELARRDRIEPALAALGQPEVGASAALALARSGKVTQLARVLVDTGFPQAARRDAAIGLRIEGSPGARAALAEAAAGDDVIAEEVRRWLD